MGIAQVDAYEARLRHGGVAVRPAVRDRWLRRGRRSPQLSRVVRAAEPPVEGAERDADQEGRRERGGRRQSAGRHRRRQHQPAAAGRRRGVRRRAEEVEDGVAPQRQAAWFGSSGPRCVYTADVDSFMLTVCVPDIGGVAWGRGHRGHAPPNFW